MTTNMARGVLRTLVFLMLTVGIAVAGAKGKLRGVGTANASTAVSGEILIKLRSADAITGLLTKYGLTLKSRFGARPIFRLGVGPLVDVHTMIEALGLEPEVLIAEGNAIHAAPEARKNRVFAIGSRQDYVSDQWALGALRLTAAHAVSTGQGIRVAVLDTGVELRHPDLQGRLLPGFDFVDADLDVSELGTRKDAGFGHGTHVAGIIARAAPGAKIMPLRVLDAQGQGSAWVLADAILFAVDPDANPATDDGAQVINLSLGTSDRTRILDTIARLASCNIPAVPDPLEPADDLSDSGYNGDKQRCLNFRGAALLAAAGNDASTIKEYPAAEGAYGLAAIGASNAAGRLASFSNFGSWVHFVAPGDGITSSVPGAAYGTWSGTSMAAPWAAATAALLMAAEPSITPRDALRRMARTASPLCGTALGQLDPLAALLGSEPAPASCN